MKYNEAYNKIIEAYFRDEIKPWDASFCFCGNLCNKSSDWFLKSYHDSEIIIKDYKGHEYYKMERALLDTMYNMFVFNETDKNTTKYEDALFAGMCAALEVLKEIHRSRGENVDEDIPAFTKRELVKAL